MLKGRANQVAYRESAGRDSGGLTQPANSFARWQRNGAHGNGVGIGHAKGWRLAAEAMGIDWMKRDELTQAIPPGVHRVHRAATAGGAVSDIKKACPQCGSGLTVRVNGETQEEFLGCSQYPECEHTEPLPIDMVLRRQGAATLPGL